MDWTGMFWRLEGRIGRKAFWIGFIVAAGAFVAIDVLANAVGAVMLLIPFALYALLAVLVKRLHDRGRSGWWSLAVATPIAAGLIAAVFARFVGFGEQGITGMTEGAMWLAVIGVVAWIVVDLGLKEGERGFTHHGPPPLM